MSKLADQEKVAESLGELIKKISRTKDNVASPFCQRTFFESQIKV